MHGHISFWKAWTVPRVALYAISFFCTKFCVYCLLLWIPTVLGSKDYPFHYES
jgi:sugar phosphate permease